MFRANKASKSRCRCRSFVVILACLLLNIRHANSQSNPSNFSTVINLPGHASPTIISSDTQVNVYSGGVLESSRSSKLDIGLDDGSSSNIEVNLLGGVAGGFLAVNSGAQLNVIDGSVGDQSYVGSGGVLHSQSGQIGDNFTAASGSRVEFMGGSIGSWFDANSGSTVDIEGGYFGEGVRTFSGSSVTLSGSDFRLNGHPIPGLESEGSSIPFDLPIGSVLSGYLQDGAPFAFTFQYDSSRTQGETDLFADGSLTLESAAVSFPQEGSIHLPAEPSPLGIGLGQELFVEEGGTLAENFVAGWGSVVHINGGTVARNFEAVGSHVIISDGNVGWYFDAFAESTVSVRGGYIGWYMNALRGSVVRIEGGEVGEGFFAFDGSFVEITGGIVNDGFRANSGSQIVVSGGEIQNFVHIQNDAEMTIAGGTIGEEFHAHAGSEINLIGTRFILGGIDITSTLTANVPLLIEARDVRLNAVLADGSNLEFDLNDSHPTVEGDYFSPSANITVTLVSLGDSDFDGDVDGADFLTWQRSDGTTAGLAAWQENYAALPDTLSTSHTVPEPTTIMLTVWTMIFLHIRSSARLTRN